MTWRGGLGAALAACALAVSVGHAAPAGVAVSVTRIFDGDTLEVHGADNRSFRVRLNQIDAPEHDQPWGGQSADALAGLVSGGPIRLSTAGKDQYGRTLATVYAGAVNVNAEMVRGGSAWAYRRYVTDRSLITLEQTARRQRQGLWSLSPGDIVEPEQWRRTH